MCCLLNHPAVRRPIVQRSGDFWSRDGRDMAAAASDGRSAAHDATAAGHDRVLVDIKARAVGMQNVHDDPPLRAAGMERPLSEL